MRVLTIDNSTFDIDEIPDLVDDIRFCVLEVMAADDVDYFFKPLLFLESFNDLKVELKIGPYRTYIPSKWSIVCGDKEFKEVEVLPVKQINDRDFEAFVFNPIRGFRPTFDELEVINILPETKWFLPKLKFGQLLCLPLVMTNNPPCIYITHQKNNKVPETIALSELV